MCWDNLVLNKCLGKKKQCAEHGQFSYCWPWSHAYECPPIFCMYRLLYMHVTQCAQQFLHKPTCCACIRRRDLGGGVRRDCALGRVCTSEPSHVKVSGKAQRLRDPAPNLTDADHGGVIPLPTDTKDIQEAADRPELGLKRGKIPDGGTSKGLRD